MKRHHYFRYLGALCIVAITLMTAITLRAGRNEVFLSPLFLVMISVVIGLNIGKFFIWGALNRRHDLSKTYPLTTVFFPLIFIFAIIVGDAVLDISKVVGLIIIVIGIIYVERFGVRI